MHTADWKIDSNPLLGDQFDSKAFKDLGNEGLLALIGDSTNADIPGFSKSESEVREELIRVFSRYNQRIITTSIWNSRKDQSQSSTDWIL